MKTANVITPFPLKTLLVKKKRERILSQVMKNLVIFANSDKWSVIAFNAYSQDLASDGTCLLPVLNRAIRQTFLRDKAKILICFIFVSVSEPDTASEQKGPITAESHLNMGTIVGGSVGGVALLMASIATISLFIYCRLSKRNVDTEDTGPNDETNERVDGLGQSFNDAYF